MGILAALIGAFGACGKDLCSKLLSVRVSPGLSTFASFAFAIPFYLVLLLAAWLFNTESLAISFAFLQLVFLRATTDVFAESFKMHAIKHADVSIVASFLSFTPIFLLVLSPLITGDPLTVAGIAGIAVIVAGSYLLIPRNDVGKVIQIKGILFAMGAAFCFAINSCFDRLAVLKSGPVLSGFAMTLAAAVMVSPSLLKAREPSRDLAANAGGFLLRGFLEITHMVGKLISLQYLSAPYALGIQRSSLLLSIIAGRIIFKEVETTRRLTGGALIFAGVLIICLS